VATQLTGCAKRAPPSPQAALAAIDTATPSTFGSSDWVRQQIASERNVRVDGNGSFAHVVLKPEVKTIDRAQVDASLQGVSSDGHGAVFLNASPEIRALKAGDVMLVRNAFAARILAAETDGTQTVLIIDQARIVDVVQSGEIHLLPAISFHGPRSASLDTTPVRRASWLDALLPAAEAQPAPTYNNPPLTTSDVAKDLQSSLTASILSGWKLERWSVVAGENVATLSTRLTKDTNGFKAAIAMDGTVSDFQFISDLKIPMPPDTISSGVSHMSGHFHFVWQIGKGTPGVWAQEDKLRLPAGITISLAPVLEGMPLTLDISSAFLIHPALTGGNEYSMGGFNIDWVGSQSQLAQKFSDQLDPSGTVGLSFQITDDANVSPVAPNAMVISFCAPRVELKYGLMGAYAANSLLKTVATVIDNTVSSIAKKLLSPTTYAKLAASPIAHMTASNALASNADVYAQVIHTEGVTHSSNLSLAPCTKIELKVTGQIGGEMQLFNLTPNAKKTVDTFDKTYTEWRPGSQFCKSV